MITVREATPADAPTIVRFQLEMARETEDIELDRSTLEQGVTAVLEDPSRGRYLIAEVDGAPGGSLLLTYEWSDWRNGLILWIQSVWTERDMRGRGVYRALWDHVRKSSEKDSGIRGIRLYVDQRNAAAQHVYSRLGMNGDHYKVFEWMKDG